LKIISGIAFIFLIIYLSTLSPLVQWLDSPGLTLSAALYDIAHPPGQPLYAAVHHIAGLLPFGTWPLKLCLINIVMSIGVAMMISMSSYCSAAKRWLVFLMCGFVLFSYSHWVQVVRQELYLLQLLLFAVGWFTTAKILSSEAVDNRLFLILCFTAGLASANHHLLAFFIFLPFLIVTLAKQVHKTKSVIVGMLLFIAGLSVFLYLPIRAATSPPLNFGNPSTWESFLWVVGCKLYGSYDHPTLHTLADNLVNVVSLQMQLITPVGWLLLVGGWFLFYKNDRQYFKPLLATTLVALLAVLPNTQFHADNPDVHGYLLPHLWSFFIVGAYGWIGLDWQRWPIWQRSSALSIVALGFFWQVTFGWQSMQVYMNPQSDRFVFDNTSDLPLKSVLHSGSYKTYSQLLAAQALDGWRPDLLVVYRGLPQVKLQPTLIQARVADSRRQFIELAISERDKRFTTRLDSQSLQLLSPRSKGWFFEQGLPKIGAVELEQIKTDHKQWQDDFLKIAKHPGLREQVELSQFLRQHYYDEMAQYQNER
jgi:hypothetical protein